MHSFYRDPARRPMVMSSGAVACLAAPEMPCRKGRRSAASESCRLRRDEDARPHIARNSGLFTFWRRAGAHLRFSRKFWFRLAGSRPPGRVSLGMESAGRAQPVRSGARARRRNPARLAVEAAAHRAPLRRSGKELKHAHMHTCIQKATQHVTEHRHAVTRPCPRALSSPVSARARPLCLLPSVLQSGRRRCSRRAAAATSPTRTDLPRPRRWRGRACTAGAGPRGREGRRARRARERRRKRLARAGLRGVGRGTTCSGRSARSAQLGDDEGDHAARSASRGQEPTPSSPPGRRIETSLRRKGVRGGGSGRACGAKAVRGGGSRRACGAPVCPRQEGAAGARAGGLNTKRLTLALMQSHAMHSR